MFDGILVNRGLDELGILISLDGCKFPRVPLGLQVRLRGNERAP